MEIDNLDKVFMYGGLLLVFAQMGLVVGTFFGRRKWSVDYFFYLLPPLSSVNVLIFYWGNAVTAENEVEPYAFLLCRVLLVASVIFSFIQLARFGNALLSRTAFRPATLTQPLSFMLTVHYALRESCVRLSFMVRLSTVVSFLSFLSCFVSSLPFGICFYLYYALKKRTSDVIYGTSCSLFISSSFLPSFSFVERFSPTNSENTPVFCHRVLALTHPITSL
jgi:hypothetical protein